MHPTAQRLIEEYLALAGHAADAAGPVFRPVTNNRTGELDKPLDGRSVYDNIVRKYAREAGVSAKIEGLCVHSLRATAATNALEMPPISPRSRSGSATPTSRRRGSMTDARRGLRTVQRFG